LDVERWTLAAYEGETGAVHPARDGNRQFRAPADLPAFTGVYTNGEAEVTFTIALENDRLVAHRRPDTVLTLTPTYKDGFNAPGLGSVRFLRDATGKVTEMSIGESRVWDLRFRRS